MLARIVSMQETDSKLPAFIYTNAGMLSVC